jgi:ferredoxin
MQSIKQQVSMGKGNYFQEQFSIGVIVNENQSSFNAVFDGEIVEITNKTTLLEQFEQKELNVTRGCGIGVCHQCVCNKKSGLVKNLRTGEISDNGEQLIQLCISQPLSDLEITS